MARILTHLPGVGTLIVLIVLAGLAYRVTTPDERAKYFQTAAALWEELHDRAIRMFPVCEPFEAALRARTPRAILIPILVWLNAAIFVCMLFGAGSFGDPKTLLSWGGSIGTRTTNGEWWRLVTALFVHAGLLSLLADMAGLVQVGFLLERLIGPATVALVYFTAGILAGLIGISNHPVTAIAGASGAIVGLYGLLLALYLWGLLRPSETSIDLMTLKRLGPAAAVCVLYNLASGALDVSAAGAALLAGFIPGLVLAREIGETKPATRQVAVAAAAALVGVVASAIPLRGIADVKPELDRLVALETRTAGAYQTAANRFRKGQINAEALAQVIDRSIQPELQAADTRLKALEHVPPEHQPLVADAERYVQLRRESWRLRAEGLRQSVAPPESRPRRMRAATSRAQPTTGRLPPAVSDTQRTPADGEPLGSESGRLRAEQRFRANMMTLGKAEGDERTALEVLQRIQMQKS